jgi:hypothetical protein
MGTPLSLHDTAEGYHVYITTADTGTHVSDNWTGVSLNSLDTKFQP